MLFLIVGAAVFLFILPHRIEGDGLIRFNAMKNLVEPSAARRAGEGLLPNIKCSYLQPVFALPLYGLGKLARDPQWWCARFNTFAALAALVAAWLVLRRRPDRLILLRFFLILLAASMLPNHLKGFYGEALTAMLAMIGVLLLTCGPAWIGWTALVLAVVNTPACGIGLLFVCLAQAFHDKRFRRLAPVGLAAAIILVERYLQTGRWFVTGYEQDFGFKTVMPYSGRTGFSYPFLLGLMSILLSFGRGLLFFSPGLLLPLSAARTDLPPEVRRAARLWLWFLAGMIAVYSKWWAWYGGWCWGPRFFLFASVPASFALAVWLSVPRPRESPAMGILVLLVLALSAWVGVSGAVYDQKTLEICRQNHYALEMLGWYVPEFSVLVRPFVQSGPLSPNERLLTAYIVLSGLVAAGGTMATTAAAAIRAARRAAAVHLRPAAWRL